MIAGKLIIEWWRIDLHWNTFKLKRPPVKEKEIVRRIIDHDVDSHLTEKDNRLIDCLENIRYDHLKSRLIFNMTKKRWQRSGDGVILMRSILIIKNNLLFACPGLMLMAGQVHVNWNWLPSGNWVDWRGEKPWRLLIKLFMIRWWNSAVDEGWFVWLGDGNLY